MTIATPLRRTPLHDAHVKAGARLVPFAGWEMPVLYTGVIDEHLAVRKRCGLFDVSHMGEISVRGPEALEFLQFVTCNDVSRLVPGRAQYSGLMLPNAGFVDDLLVYQLAERDYLLVVNASNSDKDFAYLQEHAARFDTEVRDDSPLWGQIALQGPRATAILGPLASSDPSALRYYGFAFLEVAGVRCLTSRTGYTGEDGYELYVPAADAERVWYALLGAGERHGLVPVGLGARDTLRLEAKMALYGNDIDDTTTPIEADLAWIVKLGKGEFIGRDVLEAQAAAGPTRKLVGFRMNGRVPARHGYPAHLHGAQVGTVTSGTYAPYLALNIGLAFLPENLWAAGSRFDVEVRGRMEPAEVVPTPFYKRER